MLKVEVLRGLLLFLYAIDTRPIMKRRYKRV